MKKQKPFVFLLNTLTGRKKTYFAGVVLVATEALLNSVMSGQLYRIVIRLADRASAAGIAKDFGIFLAELVGIEALAALGNIMYLDAVSVTDCTLRSRVVDRLLRIPLTSWHQHNKGYWTNLVNRDIDLMSNGKKKQLVTLLRMFLCAAGGLAITLVSSWEMGLFSIIGGIIYFLGAMLFKKPVKKIEKEQQQIIIGATDLESSVFDGFGDIKYYSMEPAFLKAHREWMDRYDQVGKTYIRQSTLQTLLSNFGYSFCYVGLLVVALFLTYKGRLQLADAMYLWPIAMQVCYSLQKIGFILVEMQQYTVASERVQELLCGKEESQGTVSSPDMSAPYVLSAKQVTFTYPGAEDPSLKQVDVQIRPGEKVAIVGLSGSGKSTLFKLFLHLYPQDSGQVIVNGRPVSDYTLEALRGQFSYLPQSPFLFEGTVRDNLLLIDPDASDQTMLSALKGARLTKLEGHTQDLLDAQVGFAGSMVSGGERQRIGLARCFMRPSSIYLMDEMASALDAKVEAELVDDLFHRPDLTVLYITHRLASAIQADRILVMKDGKIVQEGRHQDLVTVPGLYRTLWEQQEKVL